MYIPDKYYVKDIRNEFYAQKLKRPKYQAVKLPCGHNVELMRTEDQFIKCHFCGKQFLYVHAMQNKKLYEK